MNKHIETIKDKIKKNNELLNQLPNWEIEDFKTYYEVYIPEMMKSIYRNKLSKEKLESIINEEIQEMLANDIETQRAEVRDSILEEIQELELFLNRYFICCQEYGKEIDISDCEDIVVDNMDDYTTLQIPKVSLSLLCNRDNNNLVLKKNLFGNRYICNILMEKPGFYEITSSEVLFYPSVKEDPIVVGPYDSQLEQYIGYLNNNVFILRSKISKYLFNEPRREVMIDDYDNYHLNHPFKDMLGVLPHAATIYKTIKSKETEGQTTVAYLINLADGTIKTDIVDISSGKRYEVDKSIAQRDAINKVYETVLLDLEQKNNSNNKRVLAPKNG